MNYGFIYETTNLINNRKYIGKHKRSQDINDIDDSWYLGSGKILLLAIERYGRNNFSRKILCECHSEEELQEKEKYYIDFYDAVESKQYYNIARDANPPILPKKSESHKSHISDALREYHKNNPGKWSGTSNPNYGGKYGKDNPNYGNHPVLSEVTRKRMSDSKIGTRTINNGIIEKHVQGSELQNYLNNGFVLGKLIRKGDIKICQE